MGLYADILTPMARVMGGSNYIDVIEDSHRTVKLVRGLDVSMEINVVGPSSYEDYNVQIAVIQADIAHLLYSTQLFKDYKGAFGQLTTELGTLAKTIQYDYQGFRDFPGIAADVEAVRLRTIAATLGLFKEMPGNQQH